VLSTLLEASDTDFRLIVIEDCCADLDSGLHSCLVESSFHAELNASEFQVC